MIKMIAVLIALASTNALAGSLVFICHKGLEYSRMEVLKAYSAQLDEPRLVDNKPLKSSLLQTLGVDDVHYKKKWDRNFFRRALFQPLLKNSDSEVIEFVESNSLGIGYVSALPKGHPDIEICGQ